MTAPLKYPAGPITPHGLYHLTHGTHPEVTLKAYDKSIEWNLMGGRSIEDRYLYPECVKIKSLTGLIAPWRHIDHQGATQDGVTQIDSLYESIEIQAGFIAKGRGGASTRKVVHDFYASLDSIKQSELGFMSEYGYWWNNVRWYKGAPSDPLAGGQRRYQPMSIRLRGDTGFWQTYPITQTVTGAGGFIPFSNIGDQPMYYDVVCFGPGTFSISNGPTGRPTSTPVVFGPLAANQVALVRTDPRVRGVYDLTTTTPPQQSYNQFQLLLKNFLGLASANNLSPLLAAIGSAFGIAPPQGPLYSLLKGRFSDDAAIPPKSPGKPATAIAVYVSITGGGKAIVTGTPLRRYPL